MRNQGLLALLLLVAGISALPSPAAAQYKNSEFGLDVGGWVISTPSVVKAGQLIEFDKRPMRLSNGLRLGGQANFKLDEDHWWFTSRVSVGFLQFGAGNMGGSIDQQFDFAASDSLGTIFGIEGGLGLRYLFLTDRVRPYIQGSLSYLQLMTFASVAEEYCSTSFCDTYSTQGATNANEFMPHPHVGGLHLQPGIEYLFTRDIGFDFFIDLQHWLIYNTTDNNAVVFGVGLVFFT